jgi:drug/metabolite transporter (DMT)-like permease
MKQNWKVIVAFAVIYLVWGTTYLAIIFAIKDIPPLLMSAMRFLLAGIVLYIFCLAKNEQHPDYTSFLKIMFRGILMLVGGTVSVAWAEQYLPSSTTAIIVTSVPFWFILLDRKKWSYYFSNKILIIGLIIGFIGVALLTNFNHTESLDPTHAVKRTIAILVLIAGGVAWTSGSLISKYKPTGHSLLMITAIQLIVSGFFCLFISIFSGESDHFYFPQVHRSAWLGFLPRRIWLHRHLYLLSMAAESQTRGAGKFLRVCKPGRGNIIGCCYRERADHRPAPGFAWDHFMWSIIDQLTEIQNAKAQKNKIEI